MKITRISIYHKDLPLADPYWLSGGRLKFEVLDATFVKLETDAGLVGWGEGTPWGHTYVPDLGAATDPKAVMNVCDLSGYVSPRLAPDGPVRQEGRIAPPDGAGLGITPDPDRLGQPVAQFD